MAAESLYNQRAIQQLFDEMADTYGIVNLISSFGFAARWRKQAIAAVPLTGHPRRLVDLMSGMGEIWSSVAKGLHSVTEVVAIDLSPEMTRRASRDFPFSVEVLIADVLDAPLADESCDVIVSSFGLKTFSEAQQSRLADRVTKLLRPGGSFSFVEISVPRNWLLRSLYMFYVEQVIPLIGQVCLGNPANYRMLGRYTRAFQNCDHFAQALAKTGLDVEPVSYFFGCATGVRGRKPDR